MSEIEAKTTETAVAAVAAATAVAAEEAEGGGGEEHHTGEEESTAQFEPVVQLEAVEVPSGEEAEEVVYTVWANLFIFGETLLDKGTGKKNWRKRGTGEIRILRHNETKVLRLVMRQDKTMKVICNHAIDPCIQLQPNAGNDRSLAWHANDFASGVVLEETKFAVRFADSDIANDFKVSFEKAQAEMKELVGNLDKATTDAETEKAVDETAGTLAGLSTKEENGNEGAPSSAEESKTKKMPLF